ncbi:MAG: peptidase M61 [Bacteroidia bacterium]|nr:MAG: peptidase M61 [Bacteroidia bacterium]
MVKILFLFTMGLFTPIYAQHHFFIDCNHITHDQVTVKCEVKKNYKDSIDFHFPMTIPGTYDILNYGRYIEGFTAISQDFQNLTIKKINLNTYRIYQPENLKEIVYKVNDSFDTLVKENKIFEPAGTNIQEGRNYLINGGGFLGFFDKEENQSFTLTISLPDSLEAFSAYPSQKLPAKKDKIYRYEYGNYHEFIDHPIMICVPDTAEFYVNNTKVVITCYHEKGIKVAHEAKIPLEKSLKAIENFLPVLPVQQYVFLIYIRDFEKEIALLHSKGKFFKKLQLALKLHGMGFGALEHGTSSVYYLLDGGNKEFIKELQGVAIHEFLHIITPLSLHTEPIGNFNYIQPKFSKHLWLYEGSTEYHSGIVQIQNHLLSFEDYFEEYVQNKLLSARRFPIKKMSFAEMSEKVMLPKYQKQYFQVYELGALLCMALDIEIIYLTQGRKNLKTVILELVNKYGKDKSAPEDHLIKELVDLVHPDLQKFFDKHIIGKEYPNFEDYLKKVGIIYEKVSYPRIPVVIQNGEIVKVESKDYAMFLEGDLVSRQAINEACYDKEGNILPEGSKTKVKVIREGLEKEIEFPVKIEKGGYGFQKNPQATATVIQYRKIWIGQ